MNISKITGGKNKKARRRALNEKLRLDLRFVYRKHLMEIKITEYVIFLFTFITHKLLKPLVKVFTAS